MSEYICVKVGDVLRNGDEEYINLSLVGKDNGIFVEHKSWHPVQERYVGKKVQEGDLNMFRRKIH